MKKMTLEQQRAQNAWNCAKDAQDRIQAFDPKATFKDYVNDAKGLPALIMNAGLMQVMAFLQDKGKRYLLLSEHLRNWLNQRLGTAQEFEPFMQEMMQADTRKYQQVTTEAFAWLRWLRQMAAARNGGNN